MSIISMALAPHTIDEIITLIGDSAKRHTDPESGRVSVRITGVDSSGGENHQNFYYNQWRFERLENGECRFYKPVHMPVLTIVTITPANIQDNKSAPAGVS